MTSVFHGTLTGSGVQHLADGAFVPTDFDYWVQSVNPSIFQSGDAPYRIFRFVGWLQFFLNVGAFTDGPDFEMMSEAYYFNYETYDQGIVLSAGGTVTDMYYNVYPGCSVEVNVSAA